MNEDNDNDKSLLDLFNSLDGGSKSLSGNSLKGFMGRAGDDVSNDTANELAEVFNMIFSELNDSIKDKLKFSSDKDEEG